MGASIPPIGVKFTGDTDGVAVAVRELTSQIRGLSSVQRQNARSSEEMAAAGTKIASQYRAAGAALGALGTTLGVARLTGLIEDAIDTGDAIFKLSQKTGASTESLSVLAFAGRTADVSLEDLGTTLKFLSKSLGELQRGDPSTVSAFRAIGLQAKDLKGLSVDQALLKIADAQARFADGSGKAEAALRIFGRAGTEIIPLLNDLADGGFDRAAAAAQRLGLVFTRDQAKAAQDFNDSISIVKAAAAGLAGELTKGAIPAVTELAHGTADAVASLPGPLREVIANLIAVEGAVVGVAGALQLLRIAGIGAALTNPFALAALGIGAVAAILLTLAGNAAKAKAEYASFLGTLSSTAAIDTEQKRLELELAANAAAIDATNSTLRRVGLLKERQRIEEQLQALAGRRTAVAGSGRPDAVVADPAVLAARLAAQKAAIQQELQLTQDRIRAQDTINQQQFDQGLQGLAIYFARRRGLVEEGTAAEIQALEAERRTVLATPATDQAGAIKQRQDVARLDNAILQKRTEGEARIGELTSQERLATKSLAEERLGFEAKILQARGQTLQASLDAIEQEARKFDELLVKQGVRAPARRDRVADFRSALTLRANVDDVSGRAQQAFAEIEAERTRIDQEVEIGILSQRQGQQQLARFEAARLPALREMAAQMQAFAQQLGDPALIQSAAQLALQVQGIAASADLAGQRAARFKSELSSAGERSITTFLGSGLDQLGQPDVNSGALAVRQREAEEVRRQIDEANAAAAQGDQAAAARVQELTGEYARLQDKIAELKVETFGLDDAFKAFFRDVIDGIRQALNELIASQLIDGLRGVAAGGRGNAAEQLVADNFGLEAPERLTGPAAAAPELLGAAAALTAAGGQVGDAGGLVGGVATGVLSVAGAAVLGGGGVLVGSAGVLGAAAAQQLTAALALQAAALALQAASVVPGFASGGYLEGPGSPTSDSFLIRASRTEFMQPGRAVRHYGRTFMEDIRHLRFPRFATGGLVARGTLAGVRASITVPSVRLPVAPRAPHVDPAHSLEQTAQSERLIRLLVESHPDAILRVLRSPDGEAIQVQTMARNPNALRDIVEHG